MRADRRVLGLLLSVASACVPARAPNAPPSPPALAPPPSSTDASRKTPAPAALTPTPSASPTPRGPELPRGGYTLFPTYEIIGFCGTPGAPALGELEGNLPAKAKKLVNSAAKYATSRTILPAFELIAVVVQAGPGNDGKYRRRVDDKVVDEYLRLARENRGLLLLNIQPGHSDFLTELKHFEKYLREPDVGVALDPEWAMRAKELPGKYFGQTTGAAINAVSAYLSSIVDDAHLPEKALVFHQVNGGVVKNEGELQPTAGVVMIKSVDGLGPKAAKIETYNYLIRHMATGVHAGFKLFFDEDTRNGGVLMKPSEVLSLAPPPEYVMYE